MTGEGGRSAGGSIKGSSGGSSADPTDVGDTLADAKVTREDIGVNAEVGAGIGWAYTTEVVATGGVGARGRVAKAVTVEILI
jgi:hypothetical protein